MKLSNTLLKHIVKSLDGAKQYNSAQVVSPQVVLWLDPELQWLSILDQIKDEIPVLMTLGEYQPKKMQGPAIWIKCMVDRALPEANWDGDVIPILYLPGIAKADFKNIEEAPSSLQPLMEYQFTGSLWTQENGKEWTILAFLQNVEHGLGLDVSRDNQTKDALVKSLPNYFNESSAFFRSKVDSEFLNQLLVPQVIPNLLSWIEKGDKAIAHLNTEQQSAFKDVIKSQYYLDLNYAIVLDFVKKMGTQKEAWSQVWQYFANAPHKYPKLIEYLSQTTPEDLGTGMFSIPASSWPLINKEREAKLRDSLLKLKKKNVETARPIIDKLIEKHKERLGWVWSELGQSSYAESLPHIAELAVLITNTYETENIDSIVKHYKTIGVQIESTLRKLAIVEDSEEYREVVNVVSDIFYKPWLVKMTDVFQALVQKDSNIINNESLQEQIQDSDFILFVDAFRYDLAFDFKEQLSNNYSAELTTSWSAIPSLTPTSKPSVSPIASELNKDSDIKNFQPSFKDGNACTPHYFKKQLLAKDYHHIHSPNEIENKKHKYWMEIGDIDKKGHQEQDQLFYRLPKLLQEVKEQVNKIFKKGIPKITIVTDHGWLLLPGGLPKASLHKDLAATRWGRCAELKEGAKTDLLQLPWTWNQHTHIAYAPGVSFFKKNECYAHGGISLQECLTPFMQITQNGTEATSHAFIDSFIWKGMRLQVTVSSEDTSLRLDIRKNRADGNSSVLLSDPRYLDGKWKLMVDSDYDGDACTLVLLDANGVILDYKLIEIGK